MNLLEEEFTAITFSELKHLSDVDLPQCVSKDAALKICKIFAVQGASGNEIFNLWVHKLIKVFEGVNFTTKDWIQITDFFLEIIQQFTECPTNDINEVIKDELAAILEDTMELLKWFQPLAVEIDIPICCIVLGFALQIILNCLKFYKKCNLKNGNSKLAENALLVHNFVLQILSQSVNLSSVTDENEFFKLTELIQKLCICGEQSSSIDIKTNLETWKCITKLTVQCANFTNTINQEEISLPSSWPTRPLQLLISEIGRNLTVVLSEDTLQQPIAQIEKYLRVTNFYLKLLQRMVANFQHEKFPCSDGFLKTFVMLQTSPDYSNNAEFGALIHKYVTHDLGEIFRKIFKNKDFLKALHNEQMREKSNTFIYIYDELLNVVIIDKDINFIDQNVDMFIQNFVYLFKDAYSFCKKEIYNKIIEQHAALSIMNSDDKLKNRFKQLVNDSNTIMAQASVDTLCVISRSAFTSHKELFEEFRYWHRCNEQFSILSNNPCELHVRKLLLNYFDLCKSSKEIRDSEIFQKQTEIALQLHTSYYRFLLTIGLQRLCGANNNTLLGVARHLTNGLLYLFKSWKNNSNVVGYYDMIIYIKLLSTCNLPPQTKLLEKIVRFVLLLFTKPKAELEHFCRFIETALEFILNYNKLLSAEVFSELLQSLAVHMCNLSSEIFNLFYCLLNVALENVNLKKTAESLLLKLQNDPNTKKIEFLFITKSKEKNQNCQINLDLCKNISPPTVPKHKCVESTTHFETKCAKRLRIEDDRDAKFILNGMLHESEQLVKLETKIDKFDVNIINKIVNNLQCIISKV